MAKNIYPSLLIVFIIACTYYIVLNYSIKYISQDVANVIYSFPYYLITLIFYFYIGNISNNKIADMIKKSGFNGLLGGNIFIIIFLINTAKDVSNKNKQEQVWIIMRGFIIATIFWLIYSYIFL